jgi:hypothetical protein
MSIPIPDIDRTDFEALDEAFARRAAETHVSAPHSPLAGRDPHLLLRDVPHTGPERILDLALRAGPYQLTLAELEANPHGLDLGPLEPRLPEVLRTPSGKVELAPAPLIADVQRLKSRLHDRANGTMLLIGPGANSNLLADDRLVDVVSGNAVLNGIPVEVAPAGQP